MPDVGVQHFSTPIQNAGWGDGPSTLGYQAWAFDPAFNQAGSTVSANAGVLALHRISLPGVLNITAVALQVTTVIGTPTANQNFVGVWDQYGGLVGLSADATTSFGILGTSLYPLVGGAGLPGPPFVVPTPYAYVGLWWNGSTGPQFSRTANGNPQTVNGVSSLSVGQSRMVIDGGGHTDNATNLATITQLGALAKNTAVGAFYWCALV